MLPKFSISLLFFFLLVISIIESWILNIPHIISELPFCPFNSVNFYFIYFLALVDMYCNNIIFLMGWTFYQYRISFFVSLLFFKFKSILSDNNIATTVWFCVMCGCVCGYYLHGIYFSVLLLSTSCVFVSKTESHVDCI